MKVYGGVNARLQLFLNLALGRSGQVHVLAAEPLSKGPHYSFSKIFFVGFRVVVGAVEERLYYCPVGIRIKIPRTSIHPVPHPSTSNTKFFVSNQMILTIWRRNFLLNFSPPCI